jgi:hypothetical protein
VRFAKIMLQLTLLLFNTKEFRSTAVWRHSMALPSPGSTPLCLSHEVRPSDLSSNDTVRDALLHPRG